MKTIQTITVEDLPQMRGQYIVELDHSETSTKPINANTVDFYAIKRVAMVVAMNDKETNFAMVNFFYPARPLTKEEFVEEFNAIGKDRYYRLMTPEEVYLVTDYMLEQRKHI